jgi:hypothetical protein
MTNEQMAAQAAARHINRKDGSKVIPVQDGLFDIFQGEGFKSQSRFRIIRFRDGRTNQSTRQLIQVNGINLSQAMRADLLKEIH